LDALDELPLAIYLSQKQEPSVELFFVRQPGTTSEMEARGFNDIDEAVAAALVMLRQRLARDCRFVDGPEVAAELGAEWAIDLVLVDGFRLATIAVLRGEAPLTQTDRELVEATARLLATLADAERKAAIAAAEAETDPLTGLANRRGWDRRMEFIDDRRSSDNPPSGRQAVVSVVDIEGLKQWNDRHGHAAGDELLRRAASAIADSCKPGLAARIGGDEFAVWSMVPPEPAGDPGGPVVGDPAAILRAALAAAGVSVALGSALFDGTHSTGEIYAEADRRMVAEKRRKQGS